MLPFAVRTGLEPATPGVTGRYSNQLNYRTNCSDLCVFLERGCKGTHFFETSKYFLHFFQKICTFRLVSTKSPRFFSKVPVLWVRQHKNAPFCSKVAVLWVRQHENAPFCAERLFIS